MGGGNASVNRSWHWFDAAGPFVGSGFGIGEGERGREAAAQAKGDFLKLFPQFKHNTQPSFYLLSR